MRQALTGFGGPRFAHPAEVSAVSWRSFRPTASLGHVDVGGLAQSRDPGGQLRTTLPGLPTTATDRELPASGMSACPRCIRPITAPFITIADPDERPVADRAAVGHRLMSDGDVGTTTSGNLGSVPTRRRLDVRPRADGVGSLSPRTTAPNRPRSGFKDDGADDHAGRGDEGRRRATRAALRARQHFESTPGKPVVGAAWNSMSPYQASAELTVCGVGGNAASINDVPLRRRDQIFDPLRLLGPTGRRWRPCQASGAPELAVSGPNAARAVVVRPGPSSAIRRW